MKVFVDGDDIVEAFRQENADLIVPGDRERTRENVARWLARYAEHQDCNVELVYGDIDPGEVLAPTEHHGRVRVRNLQPDEDTFHAIAGPANQAADQERTYVVSEDPQLFDAVRGGDARAFSATQFLERARTVMGSDEKGRYDEPDEKFSGLAEEEVDFWVEFFGENEE